MSGYTREKDKIVVRASNNDNVPIGDGYSQGQLILGKDPDGYAKILNVDAQGNLAGGSSSIGGGSTTYSNASNDFTVSVTADSKDLTFSGLPFTLDLANIANSVFIKIDSSGVISKLQPTGYSVSGDTITFLGIDDFESGDEVTAFIIGPDKAYFEDIDSNSSFRINPEYSQWTSVQHPVDATDLEADTYRQVIEGIEDYRELILQLKGSGGVTFTVYATNDDTADDTADTGWIDITDNYFSGATVVDDEEIAKIDFGALKYMVKYVTSDTTNAVDIWYRTQY